MRSTLYLVSYLATIVAGISGTLFNAYLPKIAGTILGTSETWAVAHVGSWAGSAFLLGWAIGAIALGRVGDRLGRKYVLMLSVALCGLGMLCTGFATSLPVLVVLRCITGTGAGSILMITAVMVSEAWPTGNRARMIGALINAFPVGVMVAGIISANVADYRSAYIVCSISLGLLVIIHYSIKESVLWKKATAQPTATIDSAERRDVVIGSVLFGSMLVGLWAVFVWLPTYVSTLTTPEFAQSKRALTQIVIGAGSIVGGLLSGWFANALGRKRAAAIGYVGCFVFTTMLFLVPKGIGPELFILTALLSVTIGLNQGVLSTYIPELFTTLTRAKNTGVCMNVGRLVTTATVFFIGVLVSTLGGYSNAIWTFSGAYIVGLATLVFARETNGVEL